MNTQQLATTFRRASALCLATVLCLLPLKSSLRAQEAAPNPGKDLIATLEIRGINNVMRQAGSVMQMMGQEMELEDMQAMFGAMVMTQEGIDLDKTVRVFIPETELNPAAMENPPIVIAFPLKGDGFLESLGLSMKRKDGEKPGEAHFTPKPGGAGQLGGMPSLSSMPFHTKKVGDTLLLGPSLKFVRAAVPHMKDLADRKNVPGTVAVDLNVPKLVAAAEEGMKEMQAMQKDMMKDAIAQQEKMIEQFKKDGIDTEDMEKNLAMMKKGQGPGDAMKPVFDLLRQMDRLQFGLDAKNKMFTAYTLAEPKASTALGKSVASMQPPSEQFRKSVPDDAFFAYVGRVANLDEMLGGYMGFMSDMMGMAAAENPETAKQTATFKKIMEDAEAMLKGQMEGDIMTAILPGKGYMQQLGAMKVKDAAKMEADVLKMYKSMDDVELPDAGKMSWKEGGTRKHKGNKVSTFELEMDLEDLPAQGFPGGPNPLEMMKDMKMDVGQDGKHLLFAYSGDAYDNLADALAGDGGELFEKRGPFAKNFPSLKKAPTSMYTLDILGYMNNMAQMMNPAMAEKMPKGGAALTGWSNKLGSRYLHVDRIRFEDVNKAIQEGQRLFMGMMQGQGLPPGFEDEF